MMSLAALRVHAWQISSSISLSCGRHWSVVQSEASPNKADCCVVSIRLLRSPPPPLSRTSPATATATMQRQTPGLRRSGPMRSTDATRRARSRPSRRSLPIPQHFVRAWPPPLLPTKERWAQGLDASPSRLEGRLSRRRRRRPVRDRAHSGPPPRATPRGHGGGAAQLRGRGFMESRRIAEGKR